MPDGSHSTNGRSRRWWWRVCVPVAVALLLPAPGAAPAAAHEPVDASGEAVVEATVLTAPRPVPATDRRTHLVYEIILFNPGQQPVRFDRVDVRDARRGRAVASHGAQVLAQQLFGFTAGAFTRTLGAGESGMLLLDVTTRPGAAAPAALAHRFTVTTLVDGAPADRSTFTTAETTVDDRRPVRLRPPLRGTDIVAIGCCGVPFAHRLALFDFDGRLSLAQRYAIDFAQLDGGLSTLAGDPADNESYFIYGDQITAVATGTVVAARDGVPENVPQVPPANPGTDDLAGNFVVQDLGDGQFALYAHLQTGSVLVEPGDRVEAGQPLGRVGNTGNSSEPHLHFHLMDGPGLPSALDADGIPYVFDHMRLAARVEGLDGSLPALQRRPVPPPHQRAGQYPLTGDILSFR